MPDQNTTSLSTGPSTTPPSDTTTVSAPAPQRGKKLSLLTIIIIAAIVLLAGSAAAYFAVFRQTPEEQIKAAFARTLEAESVNFEGQIENESGGSQDLPPINFTGQSGKDSMRVDLELSLGVTNLKITMLGFEDELFIKAQGIKGLGSFFGSPGSAEANAIDSLDDQYVVIDSATLQQLGALPAGQSDLNFDSKEIASLVRDARFFTVEDKLGSKEVNDQSATGYGIKLDRDGIIEFMKSLQAADIDGLEVSDEQIRQLEDELKQEDLDKLGIEVWLQDGKIGQLVLNSTEDSSDFTVTLNITDYDQPVNVERPTNAKSLLEVINALQFLLGGFNPFGSLPSEL